MNGAQPVIPAVSSAPALSAVSEIPAWVFALVVAAFAPFVARTISKWFDARARARTRARVAEELAPVAASSTKPNERGGKPS